MMKKPKIVESKLPKSQFEVGNKIPLKSNSYLYIMAFKDKYFMAKYKGCVPFVCDLKTLKQIVDKNGI